MTHELPVLDTPRCRALLSKGLYINHGQPGDRQIVGDGNFWCGKTQRTYGPDDRLCDGDQCRITARSCYED